MPDIDTTVGQIMRAGLPVLFPDTCILLDIIRSTERCLANYAGRASDLLELVRATPPGCMMVVASIVPQEWRTHAQPVTDEVNRHLAAIEAQSSHFHDACQALGIPVGFGRAGYSGLGLVERLRDLSKQLLDNALCLDPDSDCTVRAFGRVVSNTPPSRKGGEVKDCAIIEECLTVCRKLEEAGFTRKRVFCSSNTNDYCETGKKLHPGLALEFGAVGLTFCTNLPWAIHEVTY